MHPKVEFDTPAALLEKEGGILKAMVDDSGDAAMLYDMAFKGVYDTLQ